MMKFIWENGRRYYRDPFIILDTNVYFHHGKYPTNDFIKLSWLHNEQMNSSYLVKKSSHQYMNRPFGQCFDYQIPNDLTYNSMSYFECNRKCLTHQYIERWNCVPYLIENFITEYDETNNVIKRCSTNRDDVRNKRLEEPLFNDICNKKCPKECFEVEYSSEVKKINTFFSNQDWINSDQLKRAYERVIVWDSSEPMFAYIDEPVMTFTQYLVNCGGLMGLWFGQSLKDGFSLLINKYFWRSLYYKFLIVYQFFLQNIIKILEFIGTILFMIIDVSFKITKIIMDNFRKILFR